jgi:hypothetical protein
MKNFKPANLPSGTSVLVTPIDWLGSIVVEVAVVMHGDEPPATLVKLLRELADSIEQQIGTKPVTRKEAG